MKLTSCLTFTLRFICTIALYGCTQEKPALQFIEGEWLEHDERRVKLEKLESKGLVDYEHIRSRFGNPEMINIYSDSIEFYNGIFTSVNPTGNGYPAKQYCGNFALYYISGDSIFTASCRTLPKRWQLFGKIVKVTNDSLVLEMPQKGKTLFLRPNNIENCEDRFDQIVLSYHNGWNKLFDISIEKSGRVYAAACMPDKDGFCRDVYTQKLSAKETAYIFSKFENALPRQLNNNYGAGGIDATETSVLFIKNNKVLKSIKAENGMYESIPYRLFWACVPLQSIVENEKLKPLPGDKPAQFIFTSSLGFRKGDSLLSLTEAEKHYLWTQLHNAKEVNINFTPKYELATAWGIYGYPEFDKERKRFSAPVVNTVTTDGRFYEFFQGNGEVLMLDLGYDFIKRNLGSSKMGYSPVIKDCPDVEEQEPQ